MEYQNILGSEADEIKNKKNVDLHELSHHFVIVIEVWIQYFKAVRSECGGDVEIYLLLLLNLQKIET